MKQIFKNLINYHNQNLPVLILYIIQLIVIFVLSYWVAKT